MQVWLGFIKRDSGTFKAGECCVVQGHEPKGGDLADFDWRETRLIEALRTLRIVHHSAWIARRWNDPAFPIAFPWFASPGYWNDQARRLDEQIEAMAQPPLGGG